ncbi:hypothetical protein H5410_002852 [Solanum commersonii]|uniref:DUF4283 domain-containing protein n=1 Tax=Solanum commersonii TaxID=4109 RepID=A0A9J6B414_SOLCO|nr:hypothetical protein H5410_002852 [Solanum commersonii]
MFDLEEETTTAIAWISFPSPPPNFFRKEVVLSLAATTRPSCSRVKVEVDLLGEFPKRINIRMRKRLGEIMEKWIQIKYDYGHDEEQCYVIHPELYPRKEKENEVKEKEDNPTKRTNSFTEAIKANPTQGDKRVQPRKHVTE